jgi:hypothetical protein
VPHSNNDDLGGQCRSTMDRDAAIATIGLCSCAQRLSGSIGTSGWGQIGWRMHDQHHNDCCDSSLRGSSEESAVDG